MNELFEIAKLILPALVVFGTVYFVLNQFLNREHNKQLFEFKIERSKTTLPMRLQAYERLILFLERIHPNNMVMRIYKKGMSANQLRNELMNTIRREYEHNLTQQLYVSASGWDLVKNAKEETIKLINVSQAQVKDDADGLQLSKVILKLNAEYENHPVSNAINGLKAEARKIM